MIPITAPLGLLFIIVNTGETTPALPDFILKILFLKIIRHILFIDKSVKTHSYFKFLTKKYHPHCLVESRNDTLDLRLSPSSRATICHNLTFKINDEFRCIERRKKARSIFLFAVLSWTETLLEKLLTYPINLIARTNSGMRPLKKNYFQDFHNFILLCLLKLCSFWLQELLSRHLTWI